MLGPLIIAVGAVFLVAGSWLIQANFRHSRDDAMYWALSFLRQAQQSPWFVPMGEIQAHSQLPADRFDRALDRALKLNLIAYHPGRSQTGELRVLVVLTVLGASALQRYGY